MVAVLVGIFWGYRAPSPTRAWLVEDREPDEEEQRRALRTPRRQLVVNATLWSLAVVVFVALNAVFSPALAVVVGIIVALGGATTRPSPTCWPSGSTARSWRGPCPSRRRSSP